MKKFVLLAGAILLSMQVAYADVLYRQVFGNNPSLGGGSNAAFASVGWYGYWGPTAFSQDQGGFNYNNFGISTSIGRPNNLDNVNAGGSALNTTNGLVFSSGLGPSSNSWLVATSQYAIDPSIYSIQTISFYSGNASNAVPNGIPGYRVAVEIGGNWYATSQLFANTAGIGSIANFASQAQLQTFTWTTNASAWDSLTVTPGTSLALGGVLGSDLPGGTITSFGLYSDPSGNATRRFDTFQIDAIPEPSTFALIGLGLGLSGFVLRRKHNRG